MFFIKRERCDVCGRKHFKWKLVEYAGKYFCCEECFLEFMQGMSIERFFELERLDRKLKGR